MNIGAGLYAKGTNVLVTKTITDMEGQVYRFGGRDFRHDVRSGNENISFRMDDPDFGWITIRIPLPPPRHGQEHKRMYRSGFGYIKGTLIAIADGIITPARGFYGFVIDDDGRALFERTRHLLVPPKGKRIVCRYCDKVNRVPHDKDITQAKCGHCHKPLTGN